MNNFVSEFILEVKTLLTQMGVPDDQLDELSKEVVADTIYRSALDLTQKSEHRKLKEDFKNGKSSEYFSKILSNPSIEEVIKKNFVDVIKDLIQEFKDNAPPELEKEFEEKLKEIDNSNSHKKNNQESINKINN